MQLNTHTNYVWVVQEIHATLPQLVITIACSEAQNIGGVYNVHLHILAFEAMHDK